MAGNLDLKAARAMVREARAKRGIEESGLFPYVNASGKINRNQGSEETGAGTRRTLYAAGFDAGWEVEVFGGIRRSVEGADADLETNQASLRDVLVTLTVEMARLDPIQALRYE